MPIWVDDFLSVCFSGRGCSLLTCTVRQATVLSIGTATMSGRRMTTRKSYLAAEVAHDILGHYTYLIGGPRPLGCEGRPG